MVDLVLGQGGTLKAEHGTGRIMAPFVRRQYGDELYEVMQEIKRLFDPDGLLNPGVLLDDDPPRTSAPQVHARPSRPRSTAASSAATASRSARARTSPPPRGSGSCCAGRSPGPRRRRHRAAGRGWSRSTSTTRSTPAPSTACARPPARCSSTPATCPAAARRAARTVEQRLWTTAARHWDGVTRVGRRPRSPSPSGCPIRCSRRATGGRGVLGADTCPAGRRSCPGAAAAAAPRPRDTGRRSTSRPASRHDVRPAKGGPASARLTPSASARGGGARARRDRVAVLRHAVEVQGLTDGYAPCRPSRCSRSCGGHRRGGCRRVRRGLLHRGPASS